MAFSPSTGAPTGAVSFREVWLVDFEYQHTPGDPPAPVCMVALEVHSGREIRVWRDELVTLRHAPFEVGPEALVVAYKATAELSCFLALGWPIPANILDLFIERRVETNGPYQLYGLGLLATLMAYGLPHIDAAEKEEMRRLVMERLSWNAAEKKAILDYCASDVLALEALLPRMAPTIDWPRALLRGRYITAVARMEATGIPVDASLLRRLTDRWEALKLGPIASVDEAYGVFEGATFKAARFAAYLARQQVAWPRLPSGALAMDHDTFSDMSKRWPTLRPLHELRVSLGKMRVTGLTVGADERNRCSLGPFRTVTGRNAPPASEFIFGPAGWLRALIKPPEGFGLAYIDFSSQEIGIAAGLSGDEHLMEAYRKGDPYLAFAKQARLVPEDATRESHALMRDRCKAVVLGVNYGMGADTLARAAGVTPCEARELLMLHRRAYQRFWEWSRSVVDAAMLTNETRSVFGWRRRVQAGVKPQSLMNFPMQANGAEMMRLAAIAGTESGIEVCAPVHDAFLIAAPLDRLDEDVACMRALMSRAGEVVTGGLPIRTDVQIVRWPDRYLPEKSAPMWNRVMRQLVRAES